MGNIDLEMPWVIFYLQNEQFAVSANNVNEMVVMPKVVPIVEASEKIRGVINLRGEVLTVMDLRVKMGMKSMAKEIADLVQLLIDREEDHRNWIKELESSVTEKREFKLTTDPHKCAFGKWYDGFQTNNLSLSYWLTKFDEPHKKIHAVADMVKELEKNGNIDEALALIEKTRGKELSDMINLFELTRSILKEESREIAIVLESEETKMAISVDSVASVEMLSESDIEDISKVTFIMNNDSISGIGRRGKSGEMALLIDVKKLLESV